MADAQVTDVRRLIGGLRRDRRHHPYSGRRDYSERARAVAAMVSEMNQRRKTSFIAKLDAAFTIGQAVTAVRAAPA
jgi:hypothetical protein